MDGGSIPPGSTILGVRMTHSDRLVRADRLDSGGKGSLRAAYHPVRSANFCQAMWGKANAGIPAPRSRYGATLIHPCAVIGPNCLVFQQVTIGTVDSARRSRPCLRCRHTRQNRPRARAIDPEGISVVDLIGSYRPRLAIVGELPLPGAVAAHLQRGPAGLRYIPTV